MRNTTGATPFTTDTDPDNRCDLFRMHFDAYADPADIAAASDYTAHGYSDSDCLRAHAYAYADDLCSIPNASNSAPADHAAASDDTTHGHADTDRLRAHAYAYADGLCADGYASDFATAADDSASHDATHGHADTDRLRA